MQHSNSNQNIILPGSSMNYNPVCDTPSNQMLGRVDTPYSYIEERKLESY